MSAALVMSPPSVRGEASDGSPPSRFQSPRGKRGPRISCSRDPRTVQRERCFTPSQSPELMRQALDDLCLLPDAVARLQTPAAPLTNLPFQAELPREYSEFMLSCYKHGQEADLLDASEAERGCAYFTGKLEKLGTPRRKLSSVEQAREDKIKLKASIHCLKSFQNDIAHLKAYLESLESLLRDFYSQSVLKEGIKKKKTHKEEDFFTRNPTFDLRVFLDATPPSMEGAPVSQEETKKKTGLLIYFHQLVQAHYTLAAMYRMLCCHKGRAIDYENPFMQTDYDDPNHNVAYTFSQTIRSNLNALGGGKLRAFRKELFPLLNVIRLTFLVRMENVIDKFALLLGSPISQQLYVHMVSIFSWTQFLGWIFYLPRIATNMVVSIHNARRSAAFNEVGLSVWMKIKRFFSMLWHNTSERKWQYFNDFAWAAIGMCTCFIPSASVLTPVLYLYDIIVAVSQHQATVKMWDSRRRYAASLCLNQVKNRLDSNAAIGLMGNSEGLPASMGKEYRFGNHHSVAAATDLVKNADKPLTDDAARFYRTRINLIRLYQHFCYSALSINEGSHVLDHSVCSVHELHLRAFSSWTFHVSTIIELIDSTDVQREVRRIYRGIKNLSFTLPFHVTKKMKEKLERTRVSFFAITSESINKAAPQLRRFYKAMSKGYVKAKTSLVRDAIVTTCLALGMIGGCIGGGGSIFGVFTMPTIPFLAVISLVTVFLTSLSSLIMNRTGTPTIRIKGA